MVTGASGFVGTWLLRRLGAQAADAAPEIFPFGGAAGTAASLDVTDAGAVARAVKEARPTAVVHLAAIAAPAEARRDVEGAWAVNVLGTLHLAQAVLSHAPQARFLFAGSSEAYGRSFNRAAGPIDEAALLDPVTSYGATKAAADILVGQMAADGLRSLRFRPFNHTGPGQAPAYVVSAFARQVAEIEKGVRPPVMTVGNLDAQRDFLDVRDVVDAYAAAALAEDAVEPGTILNLASGHVRSIRSVLDGLIARSGAPIDVVTDPDLVRPNDLPRIAGNPARAAALLGWRPKIPFEQTVSDVLDYWRAQHGGNAC